MNDSYTEIQSRLQVKKVESIATASNDRLLRITLIGEDRRLADLGKLDGDDLIDVFFVYPTPRPA